ncbi:hypothetical protein ACFE04_004668 [Oxalis oulophora]
MLNANKGKKERIGRLLEMNANSREDVKTALTGDIVALAGLKDTITGETLSDVDHPIVLERMDFPDPVIKVAIEPKTKADIDKMATGLIKLAQEDPSFHFSRDEEINQTVIEGMGELHLEIIVDRLKREFKVEANVGAPQVNYRESISKISEVKYVHKKQSGGQGQFADITVRFEPMESGGGYEFKSEIKGGAVPKEYIPGVMKGLEECMTNGVLAGFPVVDVRAVLVDGSYHDVDSSVLAFQLATRGAFREGIRKAGPKMLEPIMKVEVVTPEEHLGDVIGDLNSRRGQINSFGDKPGGLKVVDALVPLAEMFQYVRTLRGMTKGRASYTMQLARFDVVPQHIQNQLAAKEEEAVAAWEGERLDHKQYNGSIAAYKKGLKIDRNNDALKSGLSDAQAARPRAQGPNPFADVFSRPDMWMKLTADPSTRAFLQQEDFKSIMQEIQKNPSSLNLYLKDQRPAETERKREPVSEPEPEPVDDEKEKEKEKKERKAKTQKADNKMI